MKNPVLAQDVFIAPGAVVVGDVTIGEKCGIWFNATVRGDGNVIQIGEGSNVQDNCVLHGDETPVTVGKYVTIGHGAIVHGCTVGDNTLVGMGSIILNGAQIGKNCIIGAGALVTQNTIVPDNSLVLGSPAKVIRRVTPEEAAATTKNSLHYVEKRKEYM